MSPANNSNVNNVIPISRQSALPWWKRAIDVLGSLAVLPILVPMILVMLAVTRMRAPGPVLFRQVRIGLDGRPFTMFKFRTMKAGASTATHQAHALDFIKNNRPMTKMDDKGDARLIPLGRILRATGLDELPQVLNVLAGDMSLVGPRPCVPYEYEAYLPWQKERFNAMPGVTGLWQVSGKNKLSFEQMIRLDIQYSRTLSFWEDVRIIVMTVPTLVGQVLEARRARKTPEKGPVAPSLPQAVGAEVISRNARRELVRFRFTAETSAARD